MLKQLIAIVFLSALAWLLFKSEDILFVYNSNNTNTLLTIYIAAYIIILFMLSFFIGTISHHFYKAHKRKRQNNFMKIIWIIWALIIMLFTGIQLYRNLILENHNEISKYKNTESTAENVYNKVSNSIYFIVSEDKQKNLDSTGSAVAVSDKYLVTNCHVIINPKSIFVIVEQKIMPATLFSTHGDICIVTVPNAHFTPVKLRHSDKVMIGEDVYAIGNPSNPINPQKTISNGIISNKYEKDGVIILQTNAAVSHGSSGGGLFDHDGNLIGITTLVYNKDDAQNLNFCLPTETIEAAILEPRVDSISNNNQASQEQQGTPKASISQNDTPSYTDFSIIGTYGENQITLARWSNSCYILIPGRYNPTTIASAAIWIPDFPNGIILLSKVTKIENVFKFIKWVDSAHSIQDIPSKSYIFYNNKLKPLSLLSIDGTDQPAYVYKQDTPITKDLIEQDNFIGQFYDYDQSGNGAFTSIEFGLYGLTEALDSYNKNCHSGSNN